MHNPKSLSPKANETVLLYENGKVRLKKDYTKESSIYTRYDSFIGTKAEVEAKIVELGLIDLPPEKVFPKFELPKKEDK